MSHMTNPLATPDQLFQRRSFGALPMELQDAIFFATQCLTQAAGILLELPQSVTAQANVLLARYWLVEPLMADEFSVSCSLPLLHSCSPSAQLAKQSRRLTLSLSQDVSAAAIFLTAKLSPTPRSPRDVATVYTYLLSPGNVSPFLRPTAPSPTQSPPPPPPPPPSNDPSAYHLSESAYHAFHARLVPLEARLLRALGFDTHVALPHPLAVTYLQALDFFNAGGPAAREALARRAVAYLNAALLSPQMVYVTSQPPALAAAAVYAAARDAGAKMPECEWWEVFDVEREELGFLVVAMRSVDGWARRLRGGGEDGAVLRRWAAEGGMLTRRDVEAELARRGVKVVGNGGEAGGDAEEEAARIMDQKMAAALEGRS